VLNLVSPIRSRVIELGSQSRLLDILDIYFSVILPEHVLICSNDLGNSSGERRGMNEPIVNWGLLGDRDGLRARLGI
jgi:hypothetical protein